jgi:hypothetical protein
VGSLHRRVCGLSLRVFCEGCWAEEGVAVLGLLVCWCWREGNEGGSTWLLVPSQKIICANTWLPTNPLFCLSSNI